MLIGGAKLGKAGRASDRSDGCMAIGDRIAGRPPEGRWGLVRELVAHGSGAGLGG